MNNRRKRLSFALVLQVLVISVSALFCADALDNKLHEEMMESFVERTRQAASHSAGDADASTDHVIVAVIQGKEGDREIIAVNEQNPMIGARTLIVEDQIVSTRISYKGRISLSTQ